MQPAWGIVHFGIRKKQAARAAKAQREAESVGDTVQERQPVSAPVLDAGMVGNRVEMLFPYNVPGGAQELMRCAGNILLWLTA